jgi:hypothetical protein
MTFEEFTIYKYVRLDTDELRFTVMKLHGKSHFDLVNADEKAISAGTIFIRENWFNIINYGSLTLKIRGSLDSDIPLLEKVIGKPFKQYIEFPY